MCIPPSFKFHQEPPTLFQSHQRGLILFACIELFLFIIIFSNDIIKVQSFSILLIPIVVFMIGFFFYNIERRFDGWILEKDKIYLTTNKLFIKSKSLEILFSEISNIEYYPPSRFGYVFAFKLRNQKIIKLSPTVSEYTSAFLLKYIKENGVPIRFRSADKEIQMYVEGQIDKIPISLK